MTPQERAVLSAEAMLRDDKASAWLGMQLDHVDAGHAVLSLQVQTHHANGLGMCHGGITFALADSAFAFACNSRNQTTVAQHNTITYVAPAHVGDTLIATATEVSLVGRNGIYNVAITDQHGQLIAEFRGCSRSVPGTLFDE